MEKCVSYIHTYQHTDLSGLSPDTTIQYIQIYIAPKITRTNLRRCFMLNTLSLQTQQDLQLLVAVANDNSIIQLLNNYKSTMKNIIATVSNYI